MVLNHVVQSQVRIMPTRFGVDQTNVFASYTRVREYRPEVPCKLPIRLNPIWYQLFERQRHVELY